MSIESKYFLTVSSVIKDESLGTSASAASVNIDAILSNSCSDEYENVAVIKSWVLLDVVSNVNFTFAPFGTFFSNWATNSLLSFIVT